MNRSILLLTLALAAPALAVGTSNWKHTSEADFKAGRFDNVVATNLGDLKLSRAVRTMLGQDARISAVYAMVQAEDGTIYAGTGPEGIVLSIRGDKIDTVATVEDNTNIFSLLIDESGKLLIGTGGERGRVLRLDEPGKEPAEIFAPEGVQYIWGMTQTSDGNLYAATGPQGQLFHIKRDGKHDVVFDSDEHNLLSLINDGKDLLFVGTDPNGLVYRINRRNNQVFVLYDAAESEVTALALDKSGNLYAGTAEATGQNGAGPRTGATEQVGRPEAGTSGGVPIPSKPPEVPEPPQLPDPNPGEPPPIPSQATQPISLAIVVSDAESGDIDGDTAQARPAADENGPFDPGGSSVPRPRPATATRPAPARPAGGAPQPAAQGNAIYRIDPDGFVSEIFRQPVLVHSILERDGTLLVATGSEGLIYQINPAAEETAVIAKVEPKEVLCLLPTRDGDIYMGLANSGDLAVMTSGVAKKGTYTSPVLDAEQISRFGKIRLSGTLPKGTTLTLATRSGNVKDTTSAGWSDWSDELPAERFLQIPSPSARFLQYRLTFTSTDGTSTALVDEVDVAYQVPNRPPQIKSIQIAPSTNGQPPQRGPAPPTSAEPTRRVLTITWDASDPNGDSLRSNIYFRQIGRSQWILLKENVTENTLEWDTRTIADGRYEVRVVASDAAANEPGTGMTASRVSDPVIVDNTAPVIGNIAATPKGNSAEIKLVVADRATTVASLEYAVNSQDDWQTVLPSDKIADSPEEAYRFTVSGLGSGSHQIALRARDAHGNPAHESIAITIDPPTAQKD